MVITMFKAMKAMFHLVFELTNATSEDGTAIYKSILNIGKTWADTADQVSKLESKALISEYETR